MVVCEVDDDDHEPRKNVGTSRDANWCVGLWEHEELCIRWGPDPTWERAI